MRNQYYTKYLKYKKKYTFLKKMNQIGSAETMPILSFGTVQGEISSLRRNITSALKSGYRHLDIKSRYANHLSTSLNKYLNEIKESIIESGLPREEIWISWKGDDVENVIRTLNCEYIDTVIAGNFEELVNLRKNGLIKNIAIENIYEFSEIIRLKEKYGINTLQIQGHIKNDELIRLCNENEIKVQLYGINSSLSRYISNKIDSGEYEILEDPDITYLIKNIIHYYMLKHMRNGNVIIVGSSSGRSISTNIELYNKIITNSTEITLEVEKIERTLRNIGNELPDMGTGTLYL